MDRTIVSGHLLVVKAHEAYLETIVLEFEFIVGLGMSVGLSLQNRSEGIPPDFGK